MSERWTSARLTYIFSSDATPNTNGFSTDPNSYTQPANGVALPDGLNPATPFNLPGSTLLLDFSVSSWPDDDAVRVFGGKQWDLSAARRFLEHLGVEQETR